MTNKEKKHELCCDDLKDAEGYLENCRQHLKKVMKPAEKDAKDLANATATDKVRLQGMREPAMPKLRPYTESIPVRTRADLGRLIASANRMGRPWKIGRCTEELMKRGFRYNFITASSKPATARIFDEELMPTGMRFRRIGESDTRLTLSEDLDVQPLDDADQSEIGYAEISLGGGEPAPAGEAPAAPAEPDEETDEPMTFEEQMDFLAADEDEAISGYEKIIAECEDEHVKEQLEKILIEERAHKEFVEKVKTDRSLEYSHEEEEEEDEEGEKEKDDKKDGKDGGKDADKEETASTEESGDESKSEESDDSKSDDSLEEASTAEKRAFKNGGEDMDDLVTGKALARVKNPHERAMLLQQKRMERMGKRMTDRPAVSSTLRRKEDQAHASIDKKETKMAKAGLKADEELLMEDADIRLDDLKYFKPWGGAKDIWELLVKKEKLDDLSKALENMYPDGMKASDLNDLLWFEKDWVFEKMGIDPADLLKAPEDEIIDVDATETEPKEEDESDGEDK